LACDSNNTALVVYASHDRNLSEPILAEFTDKTGISVQPLFDTEANKTTGLVNRLLAERNQPRADVFWNNEVVRTIQLADQGVLAAYVPVGLQARPERFVSGKGYWTGFAARARVFIVNKELLETGDAPQTLQALTEMRWKGRVAIANPHFGTTGTHFSALYTVWGESVFRLWLQALRANDVALLPGNGQVKDQVAAGIYAVGLTDTDDVNGAILDGKPVGMVLPDQGNGGLGIFVIPNTVGLVSGARHPEAAKKLIDYLVSKEVESRLAKGRGAQIPLSPGVPGPELLPNLDAVQVMDVDYRQVAANFEPMLRVFRDVWEY